MLLAPAHRCTAGSEAADPLTRVRAYVPNTLRDTRRRVRGWQMHVSNGAATFVRGWLLFLAFAITAGGLTLIAWFWWHLVHTYPAVATLGQHIEYIFALATIVISFFYIDIIRNISTVVSAGAARFRNIQFELRSIATDANTLANDGAHGKTSTKDGLATLFVHLKGMAGVTHALFADGGLPALRQLATEHADIKSPGDVPGDPLLWWSMLFVARLKHDLVALVERGVYTSEHARFLLNSVDSIKNSIRDVDIGMNAAPPLIIDRYQRVVVILWYFFLPPVLAAHLGEMTILYYPILMLILIGAFVIREWALFIQKRTTVPLYDYREWTMTTLNVIEAHFELYLQYSHGLPEEGDVPGSPVAALPDVGGTPSMAKVASAMLVY